MDDVFAELDRQRRDRVAEAALAAEQTILTAAVAEELPTTINAAVFHVEPGSVQLRTTHDPNRAAGTGGAAGGVRPRVGPAGRGGGRGGSGRARCVGVTGRSREPRAVGAELADLLKARGWDGRLAAARVVARWPKVVGRRWPPTVSRAVWTRTAPSRSSPTGPPGRPSSPTSRASCSTASAPSAAKASSAASRSAPTRPPRRLTAGQPRAADPGRADPRPSPPAHARPVRPPSVAGAPVGKGSQRPGARRRVSTPPTTRRALDPCSSGAGCRGADVASDLHERGATGGGSWYTRRGLPPLRALRCAPSGSARTACLPTPCLFRG